MKKYLLVLLGLAIVWPLWREVRRPLVYPPALNPKYPPYYINPKRLEEMKDFTVLISDEGIAGIARCTGIVTDSTHILTCAHCVPKEDAEMWVYTHPIGTVRIATVQYFERNADLALLMVKEPIKLKRYPVFEPCVEVGEPIIVIGNILGSMHWFVSYGIISDLYFGYVVTDATSRGGNSGGPWLNYEGKIVGVTDWGMEDSKGQDLGVHGGISGKTVLKFLADAKNPNPIQMLFDIMTSGSTNKVGGK
jgi:S1-C subfamily serine protease